MKLKILKQPFPVMYAANCVRRSGRHSRTRFMQSMWKLLLPRSPKTWMRRRSRCVWALPGLTRNISSSLCMRPSTPRFISSAVISFLLTVSVLNSISFLSTFSRKTSIIFLSRSLSFAICLLSSFQ